MTNGLLTAHHDHDGHDHGHGHEHGGPAAPGWGRRLLVAGVLVAIVLIATVATTVRAGSATVVTRLGAPVRVHVEPGLNFKLPAPLERTMAIDLRTRTTSTGLHGVLTRDGLSITIRPASPGASCPRPSGCSASSAPPATTRSRPPTSCAARCRRRWRPRAGGSPSPSW